MQIKCLQENLSHGLGVVQRAVATRTTLPITQHVLLSTDEGRLKLSATNLDIAISTWIGGEISSEGSVTALARTLIDLVNSLGPQTIDLASNSQERGVEIKGNRSQHSINGASASEFPPMPAIGDGSTTRINGYQLRDAIHQVAFAAAVEDSRPVLTGVNVELEGSQITLAAADGFRLAVRSAKLLDPVDEKLSVIIPARALAEIERLIDSDDPIDIVINTQRSQILFRLKNIEFVSQLIQGTFPNYSQLIPHERTTRAVVDLGELKRSSRTAAIFAKDGSGIIRLLIDSESGDSGKLTISSRADEIGDSVGDIEADIEGPVGKIAFNSRFLNDVLAVIAKDKVALEMTTSSSPGVIRPLDDPDYVHVVMPMFVQW